MIHLSNANDINALKYIYNTQWGYISELENNIDKKIIDSFMLSGFIKTGFTRKFKTWSITLLGRGYVEELELNE